MRIFKNAWFVRFARKAHITDALLLDAIERARSGSIDADLGGGVIKQRIARSGEGRSKGYRSIVLYRNDQNVFFVYGFSKSSQSNVRDDEVVQFKKLAKYLFGLEQKHLEMLIDQGQLEEVFQDE